MSINDNKSEQGFLQVDNQILDLLLCDTQLNVYGILMLSKIREYQRKKIQCFVSNSTFAKMYKTSESMIKRQINELYSLGLIESVVTLNTDGVKGKTRLLRTPRNYSKIINKILSTKQSLDIIIKGQNTRVHIDFDPRKASEIKGQNEGINHDFEPRKNDTIKGQIIGSNHPISSGHSDPITIDINNIINNKLLEGDTDGFQPSLSTPSPTSSDDDSWNDNGDENAIIPDVINDANFDLILGSHNSQQIQTQEQITTQEENDPEMENPNKPKRKPNQKNDEMKEWFATQVNPISRYNYEVRYPDAYVNFAWGERERKDNQKDYYTPEQVVEYFAKENKLDYLKKIGYVEHLKEIGYPHLWMFEM